MAEKTPQPSNELEQWKKTQQLFGERGAIMKLYRTFGYLVAEPSVDMDVPQIGKPEAVPYISPSIYDRHGITSFLLACIEPLDETPEHLAARPHLELRQLAVSNIVEMSVRPELGRARQLTLKQDTPNGLEVCQSIILDDEQRVSGSRSTPDGILPINTESLNKAMEGAIDTLRQTQRLFELGHYEVKRPFTGN